MKNKIRFIRKFKKFYYSLGLHQITPSGLMISVGHLAKVSKWISQHRKLGFTDFPSKTFDYSSRYKLYDYVISTENLNSNINYLEFGVAKGVSFKWMTDKITSSDARFYGFDTFTGLPEDWGPFKKGAMSGGNEVPDIKDERCSFYQGIFQKTLNDFLKTYDASKRQVLMLDADIYSATLFVLTSMSPYLKSGDIIFFDEFNVPMHEFKAFSEWVASYYVEYEVLGEVNNYYQVAIKIK